MNKNTLVTLLAVVVLAVAGWLFFGGDKSPVNLTGNKLNNEYQAVFLSNGQVYFGKVKNPNAGTVTLTDIYYLRVQQQVQPAGSNGASGANATTPSADSDDQAQIQLVKLGDELHGPEDSMHLNREHILFFEDLKDGSQVVQAIKNHKSGNTNGNMNNNNNTTPPANTNNDNSNN